MTTTYNGYTADELAVKSQDIGSMTEEELEGLIEYKVAVLSEEGDLKAQLEAIQSAILAVKSEFDALAAKYESQQDALYNTALKRYKAAKKYTKE